MHSSLSQWFPEAFCKAIFKEHGNSSLQVSGTTCHKAVTKQSKYESASKTDRPSYFWVSFLDSMKLRQHLKKICPEVDS